MVWMATAYAALPSGQPPFFLVVLSAIVTGKIEPQVKESLVGSRLHAAEVGRFRQPPEKGAGTSA